MLKPSFYVRYYRLFKEAYTIAWRNNRNTSIKKNRDINKSINEFIANLDKTIQPRETDFKPEILIPCYNQGRFLKDALSSINKRDIAVTIINDASTDDTAKYIEEVKKEYKFKLITNMVNINQVGSLNKAIENSENNLFIVLNADDAFTSYTIDTVVDLYKKDTSLRMIGGRCIGFEEKETLKLNSEFPTKLSYQPIYKTYGPNQAKLYKDPNDINMTMSSCSFLKSAWQAVGGFKELNQRVCSFDDRDFQMRVSAACNVAVIDEPLAFYRLNSSLGLGQS